MRKKNSWLSDNIKQIAWLDHYTKPEKVEGAIKLDSNENFVLDRDFVAGVASLKLQSRLISENTLLTRWMISMLDLPRYAGVSAKCVAAWQRV